MIKIHTHKLLDNHLRFMLLALVAINIYKINKPPSPPPYFLHLPWYHISQDNDEKKNDSTKERLRAAENFMQFSVK